MSEIRLLEHLSPDAVADVLDHIYVASESNRTVIVLHYSVLILAEPGEAAILLRKVGLQPPGLGNHSWHHRAWQQVYSISHFWDQFVQVPLEPMAPVGGVESVGGYPCGRLVSTQSDFGMWLQIRFLNLFRRAEIYGGRNDQYRFGFIKAGGRWIGCILAMSE